MNILSRYIIKTLCLSILTVLFAMAMIVLVINFLDELRDIGGDYGFAQALLHVFLELPNNLYRFFPMIVLLGSVIGLSLLSSHHELMVMRAASFSSVKIIIAVLIAAILMTLWVTVFGEWVGPKSHRLASIHKQTAQNGGQAVATASGVWLHEGNNFINVKQIIGKHHLEGVTRYEFDDKHQLLATYYIKSMELQNKNWILHDAIKTIFLPDQIKTEKVENRDWNLLKNPQILSVGLIEPTAMTLPQLSVYGRHLQKNGLQATEFQFEFWKRLFQPFSSLIMILISLPLVMRSTRHTTMGFRVVVSIMIGFCFYISNALLGQFSIVYQLQPLLAAVFPNIIFGSFALYLIVRLRLIR